MAFMSFAAAMKAEEKSTPTTASKDFASSKVVPPTAQPISRARRCSCAARDFSASFAVKPKAKVGASLYGSSVVGGAK